LLVSKVRASVWRQNSQKAAEGEMSRGGFPKYGINARLMHGERKGGVSIGARDSRFTVCQWAIGIERSSGCRASGGFSVLRGEPIF